MEIYQLSRTVVAATHTNATLGVMANEATATAKFTLHMDELFDIFKSSQSNPFRT